MRVRGLHRDWADEETALLDRLVAEGAVLKNCLHLFPGRSMQSIYQKSRHREKVEDTVVDLTFDPKPEPKTYPSVYRYTKHSGKFLGPVKIVLRKDPTLGANVTSGLMGDPPVGQKLHGFQPGESNHGSGGFHHPNFRPWHL